MIGAVCRHEFVMKMSNLFSEECLFYYEQLIQKLVASYRQVFCGYDGQQLSLGCKK